MERLEEGIAEFENAIKLYEDAGGEVYSDDAKKMDLLKILPGDLGESLIWKAAEPGGFVALKDHIITMMGRILQVKKKLPLHNVDHGYGPGVHDPRMPPLGASAREEEMEDADEFLAALAQCQDGHEQLAVINRWKSSKAGNGRYQPRNPAGQRGERRERSSPAPRGATDRGPRKCPNCGGTHEDRKCPKPPVAVKDRLCWECGLPGHSSASCPKKSLKAIEDQPDTRSGIKAVSGLMPFFMVQDDEGFQAPRRPARLRSYPTSSQNSLHN